jgi:hypothetical protein
MLPILRIIPVGGVFLAILILVLALSPPDAMRPAVPPGLMPARGPLIAAIDRPQQRQFLFLAALRRADEVQKLRQLADLPVQRHDVKPVATAPAVEVAAVPADRRTDQEDVTGSIAAAPDTSMPVGIGESSSAELPVIPHQERPPAIMMPARRDPSPESLNTVPVLPPPRPDMTSHESQAKRVHRVHRVRHTHVADKSIDLNQFEPRDAVFRIHDPSHY